ncbi:hypothetical protein [Kribbella sp. NPDC048915]|uniref:hypothetical protein n=1 Tax=Kribbella sp. NPDC048915 TaxID=3155148 RepID=UPI0033D7EB54
MAVDSATDPAVRTGWPSPFGVRTRLVASSALMLFVELALIRWTGSNVVHLSYFSNFSCWARSSASGSGCCVPAGRNDCRTTRRSCSACWSW